MEESSEVRSEPWPQLSPLCRSDRRDSMLKESTCDSRHQATGRTTSTRCGAILGHTPVWQRATGGESLGVPPSHDCQREVAVD